MFIFRKILYIYIYIYVYIKFKIDTNNLPAIYVHELLCTFTVLYILFIKLSLLQVFISGIGCTVAITLPL